MVVALAQYYCTPQDVYDLAGIDAAQLRLDDRNYASGQSMQATAAVPQGSTAIALTAVTQYPMLAGTNLTFDGGGGSAPVTVVLSAAAAAGAVSLTVAATPADINAGATALDNGGTSYLASLLIKACKWATVEVNQYCAWRYDYNQLAQSNSANQWATVIAAWWLGVRVYRAAPTHIESMYQRVLDQLGEVKSGDQQVADCLPRTAEWPFFSNVTIDLSYTVRKVRVESQISEPTPTQYPQAIDYNSALLMEW